MESLKSWIVGILLYLLPKNLLSQVVGKAADVPWPKPLLVPLLKIFVRYYKIDMSEAEKSLQECRTLNELFTRRLKPGCRPIAQGAQIVHPSDSRLTQCSVVVKGTIIQAKGKCYEIAKFLGGVEIANCFEGGVSLTYYLCPTDYHRVHSPVTGEICSVTYLPGELWPVNEWSVKNISNLFSRNERVVVEIERARDRVAVVLVGATNVGQISLAFDPTVRSNQKSVEGFKTVYKAKPKIGVGEELGTFHMGSTVIVLYEKGVIPFERVRVGPVLVGGQLV